jgi:hypothetical protein
VNVRANSTEFVQVKTSTALADALTAATARLWAKEKAAVSARFKVVKRKYGKQNRK